MTVEGDAGASGRLTLLNTSFRLCSSTMPGSALHVTGRGIDLDLRNSVFADNGSAFATVSLTMIGGSVFHVTNNTVAFNRSTGAVVGLQLSSIGDDHFLWLINNVIYNNGSGNANELSLDTDMIGVVNYNIVARMDPVPAGMASSNNSNNNPMFASSVNLRPTENSPLRNAGSNNAPIGLPVFDNVGEPRPQGGRYDIGAFEFPELFKNGFE